MKFLLEGRWLALALVIALVFAGGLALAVRFVSLPELTKAPVPRQENEIGISSAAGKGGAVSSADRTLLDPDPLFLPTEFNASQLPQPAIVRRDPGASLQLVSSKFQYDEAAAPVSFPGTVAVPGGPVEALSFSGASNPYEVFGRFAHVQTPLPARQALLEVVQASTGRIVLSVPLVIENAPASLRTVDWRPLEWIVASDAAGLIGQPVLARGSGVDAVDMFFKTYLVRQFNLGERLTPGVYALRVGP